MSLKIKNRHRLKGKEIKRILYELKNTFNCDFFDEKSSVELGDLDSIQLVFIDSEPCFMYYENRIFFTLHGINKFKLKKNFVVVDMGAVRFITNGADVMTPGIVNADENINENDQVWICDEAHHKPLAVGIALMSGQQMIKEKKGRAIKLIHYVGDKLWNLPAKSL